MPDIVSEACSRSYYSCSEIGVYDEPWPRCCAGVRTPRLTVNGEALRVVTRRAHGTVALLACHYSEALHGLSCGRQGAGTTRADKSLLREVKINLKQSQLSRLPVSSSKVCVPSTLQLPKI